MDSLVVGELAVASLTKDDLEQDSLEEAGLAQILEHDENPALSNDVHSEAEACWTGPAFHQTAVSNLDRDTCLADAAEHMEEMAGGVKDILLRSVLEEDE